MSEARRRKEGGGPCGDGTAGERERENSEWVARCLGAVVSLARPPGLNAARW